MPQRAPGGKIKLTLKERLRVLTALRDAVLTVAPEALADDTPLAFLFQVMIDETLDTIDTYANIPARGPDKVKSEKRAVAQKIMANDPVIKAKKEESRRRTMAAKKAKAAAFEQVIINNSLTPPWEKTDVK